MSKSRLRFESSFGIPDEALGDEVDEEVVVRFEDLSERLGSWTTPFPLGVYDGTRSSLGV